MNKKLNSLLKKRIKKLKKKRNKYLVKWKTDESHTDRHEAFFQMRCLDEELETFQDALEYLEEE